MPQLEKGQRAPLHFTQEAKHRVFVGLGWDPNEKFGFIDEAKALMGGKPVHHDLDLSCYIYDDAHTLLSAITANNASSHDGKIYHSGDNIEGLGEGDDEQISVELKNLDENISHIIFAAHAKSGHTFGEVASPEIRLGDGYSDHTIHTVTLAQENGKDKSCYIFVHIYREGNEWMVHNIDAFANVKSAEELPALLKSYL